MANKMVQVEEHKSGKKLWINPDRIALIEEDPQGRFYKVYLAGLLNEATDSQRALKLTVPSGMTLLH